MSKDGLVRISMPPNRLKRKVGDGAPELPERAALLFQDAISKLKRQYGEHLARELNDLRTLVDTTSPEHGGSAIFAVAHRIRGEGRHFGYTCVGCIADSLCTFLEAPGYAAPRAKAVIRLHADTMILLKADCDTLGEAAAAATARILSQEIARAVKHVLRPCEGGSGCDIDEQCASIGR